MAQKYTQVRYGSSGGSVKQLQKLLNNNGYNLSVDGVFGSKTQAAVKDYQKKSGLTVDGIAGNNTWGSLTSGGKSSTTTGSGNAAKNPSKTPSTTQKTTTTKTTKTASQKVLSKVPAFKYDPYTESDTVAQAKAQLQAQLANKPDAYKSQWQAQLDDVIDKIANREKFSYDLNGDMLYKQYKDQYINQGQQAMMDTMGQAAAMTGGYGNSYAQTAGQQTYQGYLQQLNDRIPELYQLALDKYNAETNDLYNLYSLYGDRENTDYGRYRDTVSDYYTDRDYLYNLYNNERDFDYGKYSDDRNLDYQLNRDKLSDAQWGAEYDEALRQYNEQMAYQKGRDKVADEQWQKQFDAAQAKVTGSSGGSSGSKGSKRGGSSGSRGNGYDTHGYTKEQIKALQKAAGITQDGIWGANTQKAYEQGYRPDGMTGGTTGNDTTGYEEVDTDKTRQVFASVMTKSEFYRRSPVTTTINGKKKTFKTYEDYLDAWLDYYDVTDAEAATIYTHYSV